MDKIINLQKTENQDILDKFDSFKTIMPSYLEDKDEIGVNPFIEYIERKGYIREDLFDFLYHSEFLQRISKEIIPFLIDMFNQDASVEWYSLFQTIYEEGEGKENDFCKLVYYGLKKGIAYKDIEEIYEEADKKDIIGMKEKIEQLVDNNGRPVKENKDDNSENTSYKDLYMQQQEYIEHLQDSLKKNEMKIQSLENSFAEYKVEAKQVIKKVTDSGIKCKTMAEQLSKKIQIKDKYIELNRKKHMEYVDRIQWLEDEKERFEKENLTQRDIIDGLNSKIKEKDNVISDLRKELDEVRNYKDQEKIVENHQESIVQEEAEILNEHEGEFIQKIGENEQEDFSEGQEPDRLEEIGYKDLKSMKSRHDVVKRKSSWFSHILFAHSKNKFIKQSRTDQEGLVFIKMMEMGFSTEKTRLVKNALLELGEALPCFELYKMICRKPTDDELSSFFAEFRLDSVEA